VLYSRRRGRYDLAFAELWRDLVPARGPAPTLRGELVRAIGRLADEAYRNGNLNWNASFDASCDVLSDALQREGGPFDTAARRGIADDLRCIRHAGPGPQISVDGEDVYDRVTDRVVEWCLANPKT
jgi:hypothetical protein